jgi:hypothetical protein
VYVFCSFIHKWASSQWAGVIQLRRMRCLCENRIRFTNSSHVWPNAPNSELLQMSDCLTEWRSQADAHSIQQRRLNSHHTTHTQIEPKARRRRDVCRYDRRYLQFVTHVVIVLILMLVTHVRLAVAANFSQRGESDLSSFLVIKNSTSEICYSW